MTANTQASSDESVTIQPFPPALSTGVPLKAYTIAHPNAVKAILPVSLTSLAEPYLISASGDVIRLYAYDFAAPEDSPELLGEIDAHWHDVTALALWIQVIEKDGKKLVETWFLSASLDATLRRWRLDGMQFYPRIDNQVLNSLKPPNVFRFSESKGYKNT